MHTAEPGITDNKPGLSGSLGVTSIVLMVIATAAPLTVMVANTPLIISMGNGAAAPFDAMIATVIMFLFSVGFIYMSRYITNAGAFYSYIQKGMGRSIGLGSATLAVISYFMILVALEAYIGFALSQLLLTTLGITISWWLLALVITTLVGILGYQKIELSSKFLGVALVLEILIVLVVDAAIIGSGSIGPDALEPFLAGDIQAIIVGGGNTFQLLAQCRKRGWLVRIGDAARSGRMSYTGWSAGANLAGLTINTTNDMPIVDPQGFGALGLVPFCINPHYHNSLPPGHQGETRDQRLAEFLVANPDKQVVALPEGSWLHVRGGQAQVAGQFAAKRFAAGKPVEDLPVGTALAL